MTTRALHPEDHIAHYRIVSPLGSGGMGEVYLAQDETLERNVALKVLPPELVRNEERVRRFVREAKSASSLNHPNIVTIYEIGEDEIRSTLAAAAAPVPEGASRESTSVHYISMELISGETLTTKIHHDKTDLRTLLGYLAQAAEGLAKAHAAGIVHRDLKPGNIMVSRDGFTKILDFGLAKLTEKGADDQEATLGATQAEEGTRLGSVVGTVGYMSPEQVQGKPLDPRSDIFSFGCVLYEAVTRRKPFTAESSIETLHQIIHETPTPVEKVNEKVPTEVRRLIRRCLAKNPDQRLQSAKDLALELREIVDEFDSLSASGSSGSVAALPATAAGKGRIPWMWVGAAVVAVLGVSLAIWGLRRGAAPGGDSFQRMRITTLTSRGDVSDAVLSPDGRYVAYTVGPPSTRSLLIRQVATGSDVTVLSESSDSPRGLQFSRDGNYLYYLGRDPEIPQYSALFQVPSLGGTPQRRHLDVDYAVSFSPDGTEAAFLRGLPEQQSSALYVWNAATGAEQLVASVRQPQTLLISAPAWSPDGERIAVVRGERGTDNRNVFRIVYYGPRDGKEDGSVALDWPVINGLAWLPDGSGVIVSGIDVGSTPVSQIGIQPYPRGDFRRVTNDLNRYQAVSVASHDTLLAAIRTQRIANLWTADLQGGVTQRTFASTTEQSMFGMTAAPGGRVVYSGIKDERPILFVTGTGGGAPQPLTSTPDFTADFRVRGDLVVYRQFDEETFKGYLYACDLSGGERHQLTPRAVSNASLLSPDGDWILAVFDDAPDEVWAVSTRGGEPRFLTRATGPLDEFSPDGRKFGVAVWAPVGDRIGMHRRIFTFPDTQLVATAPFEPGETAGTWDQDGEGAIYARTLRGESEVRRWRFDSSRTESLFRWSHGRIGSIEWSPDRTRLLIRSTQGQTSNLWTCDLDGKNVRRVTDFQTGTVFNEAWALDGRSVVFTYGTLGSDVVLIKNYR